MGQLMERWKRLSTVVGEDGEYLLDEVLARLQSSGLAVHSISYGSGLPEVIFNEDCAEMCKRLDGGVSPLSHADAEIVSLTVAMMVGVYGFRSRSM
jgi:hypothetical protein